MGSSEILMAGGKGTGREVTSLRGHREDNWKQRPAGTEDPHGGDTSAKGTEENREAPRKEPAKFGRPPALPWSLWT